MEAIDQERFEILPHPQVLGYMRKKTEDYSRWIGGMAKLQRALGQAQMNPDWRERWSNLDERRTSLLSAMMIALGPLSLALYTPALPTLVSTFGTTEAAVKASLTIYFLGSASPARRRPVVRTPIRRGGPSRSPSSRSSSAA